MENESLAKIAIRGKGSVKEGKGKSDAAHASNQDEDLHCLIMADTEEKIAKAKKLIHQVIETVSPHHSYLYSHPLLTFSQAASIPEGQNELKRNQLRELAALNGTLRDDENQACQNCGEIGHRKYDCPHARNFTANIICRVCGNAGHMARDCPDRQRGQDWRGLPPARREPGSAIDQDYERLMNEIGGGGEPAKAIGYDPQATGDAPPERAPAPWQRGPTGAPAPWQQPRGPPQDNGPTGAPAPWLQNRRQDDGGYGGGGYGGGRQDSYGGGGYNSGGGYGAQQARGPAPWEQRAPSGGPAPWQQGGQNGYAGYGAPPPPPPSDEPPPPPPPQ